MNIAPTAPPREIVKWLLTLDLSIPLRNYKRDFSNGFLLAEILSKYYPLDVQMHSFDTGTSTGAKKNNWGLLERIFTHSIPITRDLLNQISVCQPKATTIVLTLIYSHLNRKSQSSLESIVGSSASNIKTLQPPQPASNERKMMILQNTNKSHQSTDSQQDQNDAPIFINQAPMNISKSLPAPTLEFLPEREDQASGRLTITKTLFSVFLPLPPQINFYRTVYQPVVAREVLAMTSEKNPSILEGENLIKVLNGKMADLQEYVASNNMSDFHAVFETFIPILVHYTSSHPLFNAVSQTLCFFASQCCKVLGCFESYKRLSSARDYTNLIRLINLKSMDKIPFVANIIHSFIGQDIENRDLVRIFMELKNSIISENSSLNKQAPTGTEFLFFLAAFDAIEESSLHSSNSQSTVFHLSECLTVINSFKTPNQRRSLLVSNDEEKNINPSLVSSTDLPSLEVSAVLHILNSILKSRIQLRILQEVVSSALQIFFKIVVHSNCPSNIRKAYVVLLLQLLETGKAQEMDIEKDVFGSLILMFRKFKGETLRDVLHLVAPHLEKNVMFCTPFVLSLLSISTIDRLKMIQTDHVPTISWDLPFMFDPEVKCLKKTWYAFGIVMGVLKLIEIQNTTQLTTNTIEVLYAAIDSDPSLTKECCNTLFHKLNELLFLSLGIEESSQASWDLVLLFMKRCTPYQITLKFPGLVGVLLYVHSLENTKCRRRLMGRLKKLATLDPTGLEKTDRYYLFKDTDPKILSVYQNEAERVLSIFRSEFPFIAQQKNHQILLNELASGNFE